MFSGGSYVRRFFVYGFLCLLLLTAAMFFVSNYLSVDIYSSINQHELSASVRTAQTLLEQYLNGEVELEELHELLNPALNPGAGFAALLDGEQRLIACTESAFSYLDEAAMRKVCALLIRGEITSLTTNQRGAGGVSLLQCALLGDAGAPRGFVLAGKPLFAFDNASSAFRYNLLMWLLPLFALLLLISSYGARRVARPATIITHAASQISRGELVQVEDDLPGELGEIAQAFNHMSATLARAFAELRNEKETIELILEGLNEGIIAMDAGGRVMRENTAALRLLDTHETDAYRTVIAAMAQSLADETQEEGRLLRGERVLAYHISPLPGGKRQGVVALIRDITEQERLERTRHDYVANISHELRTPLASMRGLAEGLRDGVVQNEADKQRYYKIIAAEVMRLSRLVNDLLELSGLQSNPAAFEMERVDVTDAMYELYDRHQKLFKEKGVRFTLALSSEPMPAVTSNEDRLLQILTILLDNALKYTPAGGSVILSAAQEETGVRFAVRDTGIGMDEETMRLAFDRFHQAERGRTDKGSGLGLAIAKEITGKLGLTIDVQSAPGQGSTFSFLVPFGGTEV